MLININTFCEQRADAPYPVRLWVCSDKRTAAATQALRVRGCAAAPVQVRAEQCPTATREDPRTPKVTVGSPITVTMARCPASYRFDPCLYSYGYILMVPASDGCFGIVR